jgi:DNA polymerase III subunit beta
MKIETLKDKLLFAIQKVEKVTSKNTTLPVLKCVLLEAKDKRLVVRSTNLDVGVEVVLHVKVEKEGVVAVPGNILLSVISQIPNDKSVFIEEDNGNIVVFTSTSKTVIKCLPADDFPSIPKVDEDTSKTLKISSTELVNGLKAVWYSSANSNIKPELSSVRIYPQEDNLVFVATDGFRLAEKIIPTKNLPDFSHVLIPVKNVSEVIRIFEGLDQDIDVFIDENQISFKSDDIYMVSRTLTGNFPDYKAIIPKSSSTEVVFLKQDLVNCLKMNTIFSDSFFHVKFNISPKDNSVKLMTKNNDLGESSTEIPSVISGDELDINFNYKYINDCLSTVNSDSVTFYFNGPGKPLVIKPVNDSSFLYLVMPMNK